MKLKLTIHDVILIVAVIVIVGVVFYLSYELKDTKLKLQELRESYQTYKPKDGITTVVHEQIVTTLPAKDGADGSNGLDGKDAPAPTDSQVRSAVEAYISDNPLKDGSVGPPGITTFVRKNPITSLWECRYALDIRWSPLENCVE